MRMIFAFGASRWTSFPIIKTDPFTGTYQGGYYQAWWNDPFHDGRTSRR